MRKYQALHNNHSALCAGLQQTHKGMSGVECLDQKSAGSG